MKTHHLITIIIFSFKAWASAQSVNYNSIADTLERSAATREETFQRGLTGQGGGTVIAGMGIESARMAAAAFREGRPFRPEPALSIQDLLAAQSAQSRPPTPQERLMAIQMEMQRGQGIIATLNQLQQFWQGQLVFSKQVQQPVMVMEAQAAIRECAGQIRQCQAEMKRLQGLAHAIQTGR